MDPTKHEEEARPVLGGASAGAGGARQDGEIGLHELPQPMIRSGAAAPLRGRSPRSCSHARLVAADERGGPKLLRSDHARLVFAFFFVVVFLLVILLFVLLTHFQTGRASLVITACIEVQLAVLHHGQRGRQPLMQRR